MKLLELNHVEKSFGDLSVIKDISMSVKEGEIVSIIGPSGSGKSTLLRCATMLETMDSGEVVYLGKKAAFTGPDGKVVYAPRKELKEIQAQYGLVFQNFNLFPHYSVLKNIIDAPIHVQKRDKDQVIREARELLKKMGLEDKENAYPCQLSGGQCQRVAIARALALNPQILFLHLLQYHFFDLALDFTFSGCKYFIHIITCDYCTDTALRNIFQNIFRFL